MDDQCLSRRLFIIKSAAGISSAWLASHLPEVLAAQEHAHHLAQSAAPYKFQFLNPEQATEVEAICKDAWDFAETSPPPDTSELYDYVYAPQETPMGVGAEAPSFRFPRAGGEG